MVFHNQEISILHLYDPPPPCPIEKGSDYDTVSVMDFIVLFVSYPSNYHVFKGVLPKKDPFFSIAIFW